MKHYQKIDIFRLFCACWVVLIHVLEVRQGHPIAYMLVTCLAGQAVPFFFITSGFFFAKKLAHTDNSFCTVRKYVTHNLLLYAAWMIVELPGIISTYLRLYPDASAVYLLALMFRRICFAGQGVYWYILILAESALVCGLLLIRKKEKLLYGLAAVGMVLNLIYVFDISVLGLGSLNQLFYTIFSWNNNALMSGIPYMTIGVFLARHEQQLRFPIRIPVLAYVLISIASMAFFAFAYHFRPDLMRFVYSGGLLGVLLFLIARHPAKRPLPQKLCSNCRDLSSCLYYLHTIFIYQMIDRIWGLHSPILMRYALAIIPSVLIWFIVRKLDWKPAKWMLSMK